MEIWIRSQNRELLVRCNDIRIYTQQYSHNIIANYTTDINGDVWVCLGGYSSKEKAMMVLDSIHAKTINNEYCRSTGNTLNGKFISGVFNMPQEDDV